MKLNKPCVNFLGKLIAEGFNSEDDILAISLNNVLDIKNIKMSEIGYLVELQQALRNKDLLNYLITDDD